MSSAKPAGSYGIDAPWVPWLWTGIGVVYGVFAILVPSVWSGPWWAGLILGVLSLCFFAGAALYWHATLRGKFVVWDRVLGGLPEPEQAKAPLRVLDLGCGRGAVSIQVARRFPHSQVTGIDLWRSIDQSGNGPEQTQANAQRNGVEDRLTLVTGDMASLPFADGSFDLVTASLSIHNIGTKDGRSAAIREAWRVLAPGGRLVILDIQRTGEYAAELTRASAGSPGAGVLSGPVPVGWRMWWSGPWMATRSLHAVKRD